MEFSSERMGSSAGETEEICSRVQGAGRQDGGQARRLYISPHAVNTCLLHVFAKLGVPDRVALAVVHHSIK
jgi:DNA-binding NarL/FixJ family response regulator